MRKEQGELLRVLKIGDKENRIAVVGELTALYYDGKARDALEEALLTDPYPEVRKEAAASLGRTSDSRVTAALKTAKAKDPDRDVRQAAYRSLILIEGY
jgi:HEAT repeat protein